jgi:hypothetical protein
MWHQRMGSDTKRPLMLRLSKVFADPLRIKVLAECSMREVSPKQFFEEFCNRAPFEGETMSRVSRAFEILEEYEWLRQTRTETGGRRRGAIEHFYEATEPAVLDGELWADAPAPMKALTSWRILETFAHQVKEAIVAGTLTAREDHHLTWMPLLLDQQGWETVVGWLYAIFHFLYEEQEDANARMAETGEEPIPMTVALAAFESPKNESRIS